MAERPNPNPGIVSDDELIQRLPELAQKTAVAVLRARLNERASRVIGWSALAGDGMLIAYDIIRSMFPGQHLNIPPSHIIIETCAIVTGLIGFWNARRERTFIEEIATAVESSGVPADHGHFHEVRST